jgi:hypothetical protein
MKRFDFWTVVMILTWVLLLILLFVPVGSVLVSSFYDQSDAFTFDNYQKFFDEPRLRRAFVNTLVVGFGGLVGALLLGSIMAFCVSRALSSRAAASSRCWQSSRWSRRPSSAPIRGSCLFGAGGLVRGWLREVGIHMPTIYGCERDPHRLRLQVLSFRLSDGFGRAVQRQPLARGGRRRSRPDPVAAHLQNLLSDGFPGAHRKRPAGADPGHRRLRHAAPARPRL